MQSPKCHVDIGRLGGALTDRSCPGPTASQQKGSGEAEIFDVLHCLNSRASALQRICPESPVCQVLWRSLSVFCQDSLRL